MPLKEALKKRREEINNRKEINKRTEILASSCNNTVVANLIVIYLVPKKNTLPFKFILKIKSSYPIRKYMCIQKSISAKYE